MSTALMMSLFAVAMSLMAVFLAVNASKSKKDGGKGEDKAD